MMKDCKVCRFQYEERLKSCPICKQHKNKNNKKSERTVPKCILCGKKASHYYDQDNRLQVYHVPYELQFAFMKFKFPICMPCDLSYKDNREGFWKKIHSFASEQAAHYWSGWMEDKGFY